VTTAGAPLPVLTGVTVREKGATSTRSVRGRYVVVADGSNSRVGRMLGTTRRRDLPLGMALRGYYRSERHDDPFIESHLDIRDPDGNVVPGYGWIFPMGDGTVNVGVGLLSTEARWKGINTSTLMDTFVGYAPVSWGLSPEKSLGPPTGGKLPMGLSVGPRAGGNVLVVGDAGGAINPFNGEGIAYGYEMGRLAAAALGHAMTGAGEQALRDYDRELTAAYGPYYKVARAFVHLISRPEAMRVCVNVGMRSELFMNQLLRIMANLMRPDAAGPAEIGYRAMELVSRFLPDPDVLESPAA
jgi:flavin-dependent dehydrogenase